MRKNIWLFNPGRGITLIELMVVLSIGAMITGIVYTHYRNSRLSSAKLAQGVSFQMDVRRIIDKVTESLNNATEIVKPIEGSSLPFLVVKDLRNHIQIFFLEKPKIQEWTKPFPIPLVLVSYVDKFDGGNPENRVVLAENIRKASFTNSSLGLVTVNLVMVNDSGNETSFLFELPLSNLSSIDEHLTP